MNIHKHMEAIFVIVLAVVGLGSYLFDQLPEAQAKVPIVVARNVATPTTMAVVVIRSPLAWKRG